MGLLCARPPRRPPLQGGRPQGAGCPLKAEAGMQLGSAPQLDCKALSTATALLPPSLALTLPLPPEVLSEFLGESQ